MIVTHFLVQVVEF